MSVTRHLTAGGLSIDAIDPDAYNGGTSLTLTGKSGSQQLIIGQYQYGWALRFIDGDRPEANIAEFYVPDIFSIASSSHVNNPVLAVRDNNDGCDISIRVSQDKQWGELRVGNLEGDYPGFFYHHRMGLRLIVDDGQVYRHALSITPDASVGVGTETPLAKLDVAGAVRATDYQAADGTPGFTGSIDTGHVTLAVQNGLITGCTPK